VQAKQNIALEVGDFTCRCKTSRRYQAFATFDSSDRCVLGAITTNDDCAQSTFRG
jgi:hypothetical protein